MPYLANGKIPFTATTDVNTLCEWARVYSTYGQYAQEPHIRYYIGFYQISQGIRWENTDSEYESWASACVHMIGATEMLCPDVMGVEEHLPKDLTDLERAPISWRLLMLYVSRGMQMVHYGATCFNTIQRRKRFQQHALVADVASAVRMLMSAIPKEKRAEAIEHGTKIMTGVI